MAIFKAVVHSNYAQIPNETAQDTSISFEARGLLTLLLSMPNDWEVHKSWVVSQSKAGKDKVNAIFDELMSAGYIRKEEGQRKFGKFSSDDYFVFPTKTTVADLPQRSSRSGSAVNGESATTKETVKQKKQETKETLMSPTGSTAPEGADSVCSVCNGDKRLLVETQANGMRSASFRDCNHCNGTGKEPVKPACSGCNGDGWITMPNGAQGGCWVCGGTGNQPVVNSESTPVQPEITFPAFRVCEKCGNKRCPHAHDKRDVCTGSNELGQIGSFTGYCAHPDRLTEQPPKADKPLNVPFEDFWNLYNKKVGRKKAETRWKRLTNKDRAAIMEHLPNYIRNTPDVQYRKNPETYLNAESWNDELPNMRKPGRPEYPENQGVDKSIHTKQMTGLASELTSEQRKAAQERIKAMLRDGE